MPQQPPTMLSPNSLDEPLVRVAETVRREVVVRVPVDDRRQPRVREARQERAPVLREVAQVLGHLGRTGRAVHADDIGAHRLERGDRGADLGADEHAAGRLDRDLHHEREERAGRGHRPAGAVDRGLGLEQVVDGLDEEDVDAAREQPDDLRLVVVAEDRRSAMWPSDGSLVPGPIEPITNRGWSGVEQSAATCLAISRRALVDLERVVRDLVLVQHERERAERRGLDRVDARIRRTRRASGRRGRAG